MDDGGYGLGDKVPHLNRKGEVEENEFEEEFEGEETPDPKKVVQQVGGKGGDAKAGAGADAGAGKGGAPAKSAPKASGKK